MRTTARETGSVIDVFTVPRDRGNKLVIQFFLAQIGKHLRRVSTIKACLNVLTIFPTRPSPSLDRSQDRHEAGYARRPPPALLEPHRCTLCESSLARQRVQHGPRLGNGRGE